MIASTIRFLSESRKTLLSRESAQRLAAGATLGMIMGLVPKDSLFVWMVGLLLVVTTANLVSATVSCLVFSWVGLLLDPFAHRLGAIVLTADALEPLFVWLSDLPVVPWTRFNNTVVLGSLLSGLALAIPFYLATCPLFQTVGGAIHERVQTTRLYRWLIGGTPAGEEPA